MRNAPSVKLTSSSGGPLTARRPLSKADGAALVYFIIHAKLAAAKVGIADTSGLRLAQHRP